MQRFYSLEEAIENGQTMPTINPIGTGFPTTDGIDDGMFQDPMTDNPIYPTTQSNYPTAQGTYGMTGAVQSYPEAGAVYPTQNTYQTESMIDQFERETAAQDDSMMSQSMTQGDYPSQYEYQTQPQTQSQQPLQQFQPQTQPLTQQTQQQTQSQMQLQTQTQSQTQTQNQYQPRPQLQTQLPIPLPKPVLANHHIKPLVPPSPPTLHLNR